MKMILRCTCVAGGLILSMIGSSPAQTPLTTTVVAEGFTDPVFVTFAPGDTSRLFVLEQGGRIKIIKNGVVNPGLFLNVSSQLLTGGERGLLGLAFHPNYQTNGYFYINYTVSGGGSSGQNRIRRFQVSSNADSAKPAPVLDIIDIAQPFPNHNAGGIAFGPRDGYLYIPMGDGGSANDPGNRGQAPNALLGKVLRIDVDNTGGGNDYAIPPGNPWSGIADTLDEIWSFGMRNPWRWSFDRATGDLWIADVGQGDWEEINFAPFTSAGRENYGWRLKEGLHCFIPSAGCDPGSVLDDPIYEYEHATGPFGFRISVTGGYVYRGCAIPDLNGTYFFADYGTGEIWSFRYDGSNLTDFQARTNELTDGNTFLLSSFGEDYFGELYICDYEGGRILKIVPDGVASQCSTDGCCSETVGDANGVGGNKPSVADIGTIVDFLFISGTPLICVEEADANQSGGATPSGGDVSVADIGILVDHLFISGTPLADCL